MSSASESRPESYYQTLGVSSKADDVEIRLAYLTLLRGIREHPEWPESRIVGIVGAYETLTDPLQRPLYDLELNERHYLKRAVAEAKETQRTSEPLEAPSPPTSQPPHEPPTSADGSTRSAPVEQARRPTSLLPAQRHDGLIGLVTLGTCIAILFWIWSGVSSCSTSQQRQKQQEAAFAAEGTKLEQAVLTASIDCYVVLDTVGYSIQEVENGKRYPCDGIPIEQSQGVPDGYWAVITVKGVPYDSALKHGIELDCSGTRIDVNSNRGNDYNSPGADLRVFIGGEVAEADDNQPKPVDCRVGIVGGGPRVFRTKRVDLKFKPSQMNNPSPSTSTQGKSSPAPVVPATSAPLAWCGQGATDPVLGAVRQFYAGGSATWAFELAGVDTDYPAFSTPGGLYLRTNAHDDSPTGSINPPYAAMTYMQGLPPGDTINWQEISATNPTAPYSFQTLNPGVDVQPALDALTQLRSTWWAQRDAPNC